LHTSHEAGGRGPHAVTRAAIKIENAKLDKILCDINILDKKYTVTDYITDDNNNIIHLLNYLVFILP
jgi:hypothetical protein